MKKGDIIELTVEGYGMDGEGVARADGMVIFIPFAMVGEKVRVQIKSVKKSFCRAGVIKVLEPSPVRVKPECENYFRCGGCDMMHLNYEEEKRVKISDIENNLMKIGGISKKVDKFIDSPKRFNYRNKAQFPFGLVNGRLEIGYYKSGTHDLVACENCRLIDEGIAVIAQTALNYLRGASLSVYDEITGKGLLRHMIVRRVGEEFYLIIVINGEKIEGIEKLSTQLPQNVSLYLNRNTGRTNAIAGSEYVYISGKTEIPLDVLGVKAALAPGAFMQVNDGIRDILYRDAAEMMSGDTAIDLYSGIGITSNLLIRKFDKVYSIEIVKSACENAEKTARLNGNESKIDIICGDAAEVLPKLSSRVDRRVSVLLDPPRKGVDKSVLGALIEIKPDNIVYISCNPSTLARDLKELINNGYEIDSLNAYDMFPNTHHVETLAALKRKAEISWT